MNATSGEKGKEIVLHRNTRPSSSPSGPIGFRLTDKEKYRFLPYVSPVTMFHDALTLANDRGEYIEEKKKFVGGVSSRDQPSFPFNLRAKGDCKARHLDQRNKEMIKITKNNINRGRWNRLKTMNCKINKLLINANSRGKFRRVGRIERATHLVNVWMWNRNPRKSKLHE